MRLDLLLRSTTTPQQGWRLLGYTDGGGGSVIWGPGWEGGGDDYIRAGYGQGEGWDDNHYADKPVTIHRRVWRLCVARGQGGACERMRVCAETRTQRRRTSAPAVVLSQCLCGVLVFLRTWIVVRDVGARHFVLKYALQVRFILY